MFSIYLSNKEEEKGNVAFGGYDLEKYAKKGLGEKDIFWADQSRNEEYWAVNSKTVTLGGKRLGKEGAYQQTILDNGMSFAMAPQADFSAMIAHLKSKYGILCQ